MKVISIPVIVLVSLIMIGCSMLLYQLNKGMIRPQISTDEMLQDDHRCRRKYLCSSVSFNLRSSVDMQPLFCLQGTMPTVAIQRPLYRIYYKE